MILACLVGLGLGIGEISVIDPHSEIVQVYDSVFSAIRDGRNPYTAGTIFHYAEFKEPVFGNFNTRRWKSTPTTWPTRQPAPGTARS